MIGENNPLVGVENEDKNRRVINQGTPLRIIGLPVAKDTPGRLQFGNPPSQMGQFLDELFLRLVLVDHYYALVPWLLHLTTSGDCTKASAITAGLKSGAKRLTTASDSTCPPFHRTGSSRRTSASRPGLRSSPVADRRPSPTDSSSSPRFGATSCLDQSGSGTTAAGLPANGRSVTLFFLSTRIDVCAHAPCDGGALGVGGEPDPELPVFTDVLSRPLVNSECPWVGNWMLRISHTPATMGG